MKSLQFRAMNTEIVVAGEGQPERLDEGLQQAETFVRESEGRFSRFAETSELSALNRSAGAWFEASPELFSVILLARRFFHLTRGLFDPSILPDLRRIGYDRSMDVIRTNGARPLLESILHEQRPSFLEMDLDEATESIYLPQGMALDLGGLAKGWIAEQAAGLLSGYANPCAVNAGGDMFLVGLPDGLNQWPVELEDPFDPAQTLTILQAGPGALATSSVTKRTWMQGDKARHHLIDPRTGEPAAPAWASVTVLAPHAYEAEVFAKALLIGQPAEAEEMIRTSGIPLRYVAVDWQKNLTGSQFDLLEAQEKIREKEYVH